MNILLYAPGSGGGHLNRMLALISWVSPLCSKISWIQSSPLFLLIKDELKLDSLEIYYLKDPETRKDKIRSLIDSYDLLIIDSFLLGTDDELLDVMGHSISKLFVFRPSRMDIMTRYDLLLQQNPSWIDHVIFPAQLGHYLPTVAHTVLDPIILSPERWAALKIAIKVSPTRPSAAPDRLIAIHSGLRVHLVHLGPQKELNILRQEARILEEQLDCTIIEYTPRSLLFPGFLALMPADLLICGAGYNSLAEIVNYGKKAIVMPFSRKFDDQFARAISYRQHYPHQIFHSALEYIASLDHTSTKALKNKY